MNEENENDCPKCGSKNVYGLMKSFWVPLTASGDTGGQWLDYQSETEVGEQRECGDCEHRWIYGAE